MREPRVGEELGREVHYAKLTQSPSPWSFLRMSTRRGSGASLRWGPSRTPCQFSFLKSVPWTVIAGNVLESLVSQEREPRQVEEHTQIGRDRQTRARQVTAREKKKRGKETWRMMERGMRERRSERASCVSAHKVPGMGGRGARLPHQLRPSHGSVQSDGGVWGGELVAPRAEMSEVAWGRFVWREEARGRGKGAGGREKTPPGDATQRKEAKENFQECSKGKKEEAL